MKRYSFYIKINALVLFTMLLSILLWQCKDPEISLYTTTDVNITGYLQNNDEEFSEFLKILKIAEADNFLSAYGTYTLFAPVNSAVNLYVQQKSKASVDDIEVQELKEFVKFHILKDTISTTSFTDGKITTPTMLGQFLITGVNNSGGISNILINRQSNLIRGNIKCGNGIVHVIDHVLEPAKLTITEMVKNNPDYSIFYKALTETGYDEILNTLPSDANNLSQWYTLIAETDSVFKVNEFDTYEELKARYSHLKDPKNPADSLNLFVAYHILPGLKYVADIVTASSHATMVPSDVITIKLDGQTVRINADFIGGVQEKGSSLLRTKSDFSATNGVFHTSGSTYAIKIRTPYPVYWDVADQPECRNLSGIFRKTGNYVFQIGTMANVDNASTMGTNADYLIAYVNGGGKFIYGDYLRMGRLYVGRQNYVELKTPLLVKGKYKVWVCYRVQAYNDVQAHFNDEPLPRIFGLNPPVYISTDTTLKKEREWEALGWKHYTKEKDRNFVGRLLGTVEVKTTGTQKFKLVPLTTRAGATGNMFWLDMVHFIPTNIDQIYPLFDIDGTKWGEDKKQVE